jgi:hypothetical protein
MSKFDRYKKKHKNDPKPEKKVLPKPGSVVESKEHGIGMVVDANNKEAKALYLDGLMRALENSK